VKPLIVTAGGLIAALLLERFARNGGPLWPFAKLLLVLGLMVLLLREGVTVGLALLAGAVALGLAFRVPPGQMAHAFTFGLFRRDAARLRSFGCTALRLSLIIFLINFLGRLLILGGGVRLLVESLERLFRDVRWVLAAIPAVIGLLPTPGGAMLSAPMVAELGDRLRLAPEQKVLANYWFRHIWEWWWPMFPAILIVLEDRYLTLPQLLVYLGPMTVAAVGLGWVFLLRRVPRGEPEGRGRGIGDVFTVLRVLWPVIAVVAAVLVVRLPTPYGAWVLPVALAVVDAALLRGTRLDRGQVLGAVRLAAHWPFFLLVFGVYVLRGVFVLSGAAEGLPAALATLDVPAIAACFIVPFAVNVLTGYNLAGVGMAFPLLAALFAELGPGGVAVAYGGAFLGVLSSPVHLCLALTREFFKAEWGRVYALLVPMLIGMLVAVALVGWLG